ncbi:hypothetical protein G7Z17_g11267 [Cylindrodendrum hubeiense]|uniref:Luciferase-like domain-containing protein n=1 Tax=Cylindrodendrum hubeiense TaxID=595255 RepID=A0A9P5H1C7_9HYPO|nr:hypothetical protein G7Z17_g11267 [Cylindrodendrum hubeiense]
MTTANKTTGSNAFVSSTSTEPLSLDLLQGRVEEERQYGYTKDGRKKRILLNAFDMNGIGHISIGQWQNPEDKSSQKNKLPYWIELAKLLEKGKFNALFLADNFGSHDVYKGSHAPAIQTGTHWPLYDPFTIISAMAAVTDTLAFGVTACTTFEPPFSLAKRFSTLDHLTNGRVAWNIVTSWSDNAARAFGLDQLPEHDTRYAMAEEYLDLAYKHILVAALAGAASAMPAGPKLTERQLWYHELPFFFAAASIFFVNGCVGGEASDVYSRVLPRLRTQKNPWGIFGGLRLGETVLLPDTTGTRIALHESAHQVDPSPQRTPVLFQAGMSPAGSAFAAKHAECVFVGGPSPAIVAGNIRRTRALAALNGRDPYDLKFFTQITPILGVTDEDAREKLERYKQYALGDDGLALFGGTSGIDVSKFPQDEEFPTDPENPLLKDLTVSQRNRLIARPKGYEKWTPMILAEYQSIGGSGVFVVGSGATVADELERWITEADVDGFNVGHIVVPGAWEDVIKYLTPELERRGWLGNGDYPVTGGTARENLYGTPKEAHLRPSHPGFRYKWAEDQH